MTRPWESTEYKSWRSMMDRVYGDDPKHAAYKRLTVCQRWRDSYKNFIEDMGPKPTPDHTIDRIDGELGYFPENCRWSTVTEQNRNRSISVIRGTSVAEIASEHGIAWATARRRIARGANLGERLARSPDSFPHGERSSFAKLTEADVRLIRASNLSEAELADQFNTHRTNINLIQRRKTWKNVV